MKAMVVERTGTFMIEVHGPNHCGTHDHHEKLRYHMVATCNYHLNDRGFLFDQMAVERYFQGIKKTTLSCERLVAHCCTELLELIREENPSCPVISLKLSLSPDPFAAEMTTELTAAEIQAIVAR